MERTRNGRKEEYNNNRLKYYTYISVAKQNTATKWSIVSFSIHFRLFTSIFVFQLNIDSQINKTNSPQTSINIRLN